VQLLRRELGRVPPLNWLLLVVTLGCIWHIQGLVFTLAVAFIFLSHELGHYIACRRYGLNASHPYFIPGPWSPFGTFGAFISIREPFHSRRVLFDVGVAGPLAGFAATVLVLVVDFFSRSAPQMLVPPPGTTYWSLGEPLLLKLLSLAAYGRLPVEFDTLSPLGLAGWVGLLLTALNLIPAGQLDGGHIAYAMFGRQAQGIGAAVIGVLVFTGVVYWPGWLFWALLLLLMGVRHPPYAVKGWDLRGQPHYYEIEDRRPLDPRRRALCWGAALIFLLSVTPVPLEEARFVPRDPSFIQVCLEWGRALLG
jgi:membrane-associated protease RseP (regulator of RpoE activity)